MNMLNHGQAGLDLIVATAKSGALASAPSRNDAGEVARIVGKAMEEALKGPSPEDLYEAMCRATEQVFATMLNMEVEPGVPIFEHDFPGHFDGVVSFVGLAGGWLGTGGLSCSASFARRIAGCFLMMDFAEVDDDVLDAVGELTNIIIGNLKGTLEQSVGPMALSTPTSIVGNNLTAHSLGRHRWTVVSFRCGEDKLDVMVHLVPRAPSDREAESRRRMLVDS
jgi:chemotaxis protein CheX